ncbi:RNA polymerase sigma factor SigJ [Nocardia aurantia]|uniref:RNA polymerase sigma factor SigJ n=1 Tax=Nocardia aurantia TaxID=2585199 RepID=UPI0012973F08|nr:RNA polymerase sigma factor SigJ [Nocardia aurantia]
MSASPERGPDREDAVDDTVPDDLHAVAQERRALMNLGYRLLGSVADAEDAVQETYLRWYKLTEAGRQEIESPMGWLMTTAGRVCLDMLGSARARRERYVGEWLPEPLPDPGRWTSHKPADDTTDPADQVTLDESVAMALLLVLEGMTPAERVAFVLHDVFQYRFTEIADIVGRSPGACRQLASSARRRVDTARVVDAPPQQRASLAGAFRAAWQTGDLAELVRLLDPQATAVTDGGGLVSASIEPIVGAPAVARFFLDVFGRQPDLLVEEALVNGEPGLVAHAAGEVLAVISLGVTDGRIDRIWVVRNPEKLAAWN